MHLFKPGLCINPVYCVHKIRFPAYSCIYWFALKTSLIYPPTARIITWMYILMYIADSFCQTSLLYPGTTLIRTCSPHRHTSRREPLYTLPWYFLPLCAVRGLRAAPACLRHRSYSPAASMSVSSWSVLIQCPFYHAPWGIQTVFASVWYVLHPFQIKAHMPLFPLSCQYC